MYDSQYQEKLKLEKELKKKIKDLLLALTILLLSIIFLKFVINKLEGSPVDSVNKVFKDATDEAGEINEDEFDDAIIGSFDNYNIEEVPAFEIQIGDGRIKNSINYSDNDFAFLEKRDLDSIHLFNPENDTRLTVYKGENISLPLNTDDLITFTEEDRHNNGFKLSGYDKKSKDYFTILDEENEFLSYLIINNHVYYTLKNNNFLHVYNLEDNEIDKIEIDKKGGTDLNIINYSQNIIEMKDLKSGHFYYNLNSGKIAEEKSDKDNFNMIVQDKNIEIITIRDMLKNIGYQIVDTENSELIFEGLADDIRFKENKLYIKTKEGFYVYDIEEKTKPTFLKYPNADAIDFIIFNEEIMTYSQNTKEMKKIKDYE